MSIEFITYVWKNELDIKGTRLLLMLAYADFANESGESWAMAKTLAQRIRGSAANIRPLKNSLITAHKIIRIPDYTDARQTSDRIIIVAPGLNCDSYDQLCQQYGFTPVPYIPLPEERRGGNNPDGKNMGGLNSTGGLKVKGAGGLNSTGAGGLKSSPDPSIIKPSKNPAAPRRRDPIFDIVAICLFSADLNRIDKVEAKRIGMVSAAFKRKYPDITQDQIAEWCEWHRANKDYDLPLDAAKVLKHFGEWFDGGSVDISTLPHDYDPDCPHCHGTGTYQGSYCRCYAPLLDDVLQVVGGNQAVAERLLVAYKKDLTR